MENSNIWFLLLFIYFCQLGQCHYQAQMAGDIRTIKNETLSK